MNAFIKKITAVIVLVFMGILSLLMLFGKSKSSEKFPEVTLSSIYDGSFFSSLEKYSAERSGIRSEMMQMKSKISSSMGESLVNGVYIDNERLLDAEISDREVSFDAVSQLNTFAKSYDGTVYLAAIPTSSGVYGEKLPSYLLGNPESQQISSLYEMLSGDVRKIDAYNILKMLNDNYIYFRSDTKWTSYGAYCVYRTVIQKLGFLPTPYDKYTIRHVTDEFRGNLYDRTMYSDTNADLLDIYEYHGGAEAVSCTAYDNEGNQHEIELYDMDKLNSAYKYDMYLGNEAPVIEIESSIGNMKKLLVIKDSYADCFIPFLLQHYNTITVVSPEYMDRSLGQYIDLSDYEQVLILFGIENIGNEKLFANISK